MTKIKVNSIVNKNDDGPTELKFGASIPSGQSISGSGGINVVGVITASEFSGNGAGLTGLPVATKGKSFAYKYILDVLPFRS
jgi:hypothetical protein